MGTNGDPPQVALNIYCYCFPIARERRAVAEIKLGTLRCPKQISIFNYEQCQGGGAAPRGAVTYCGVSARVDASITYSE